MDPFFFHTHYAKRGVLEEGRLAAASPLFVRATLWESESVPFKSALKAVPHDRTSLI